MNLWTAYFDDIIAKGCEWCAKDGEFIVYDFFGETVCQDCLMSEQYEEPETGLTLVERNK